MAEASDAQATTLLLYLRKKDSEAEAFAKTLFEHASHFKTPKSVRCIHKQCTYLIPFIYWCVVHKLYDESASAAHDAASWDIDWDHVKTVVTDYLDGIGLGETCTFEVAERIHTALELPLMTAHNMQTFLKLLFIPFYVRRPTPNDQSTTVTHVMVDQCIQAGERIAKSEHENLLRLLQLSRAELNLRSPAVTRIKKDLQLQTSCKRRLRGHDALVGTALLTINSESMKKMSHYALTTGKPEHIRTVFYQLFCTATCLRGGTLEKVCQNYCFLDRLGDPHISNLDSHQLLAVLHDKSKENQTGHRQVTGAVHSKDIFSCPCWFFSAYLVIKFVIWDQFYPDFDDPASWYEHHIMQQERSVNVKTGMTDVEVRKDIQYLYTHALHMTPQQIAQVPQRHAWRHCSVMIMNSGGVLATDQNCMGWNPAICRRHDFYGWNTMGRTAALTLAGTARDGYGHQIHRPPHRFRFPSKQLCRSLYDPPYRVRDDWKTREGGPPCRSSKGFNALMCELVLPTFIQGLPIILRRYGTDNPGHFLNHPKIKVLTSSEAYNSFAVDQLASYDLARLSPENTEQVTLNSVASAQFRHDATLQSLTASEKVSDLSAKVSHLTQQNEQMLVKHEQLLVQNQQLMGLIQRLCISSHSDSFKSF